MDVAHMLLELARHPLDDQVFAQVARTLLLAHASVPGSATPVAPPVTSKVPVDSASAASPSASSSPLNASVTVAAMGPPAPASKGAGAPPQDRNVRYTVKDAAGHRTTLCLPRGFRDSAAQRLGGLDKLGVLVRHFSRLAPVEILNRSGWVQERLEERMKSPRDTLTPDMFEA